MVFSWEMDDPVEKEGVTFEDEILIMNLDSYVIFDFPLSFYRSYVKKKLRYLNSLSVSRSKDSTGGPRVLVTVDKDKGMEVKSWLLLVLQKDYNYFTTEVENI